MGQHYEKHELNHCFKDGCCDWLWMVFKRNRNESCSTRRTGNRNRNRPGKGDRSPHGRILRNEDGAGSTGHFNVEIDMAGLEKACIAKKEMRENIMGYQLANGRWVNVIAEGRLANIAAADGHPAEIMDMSFAVQALSAMYIRDHHKTLKNDVIDVSDEIDDVVARRRLEAWDIEIDTLTPEQVHYLNSWEI